MTGTENLAARRGDLVIIHLRLRDTVDGTPHERDRFWLGQVTGVTPDGGVRLYRPAGRFPEEAGRSGHVLPGRPLPDMWFKRALVASARQVDVEGALATAACHVWLGREDEVRAYNSMNEVRAALRPHRLDQPGRAQLRDAARTWKAARIAALPLRAGAGPVRVDGSGGIPGAYTAAVTAANSAYRQQRAASAWLWSRAA